MAKPSVTIHVNRALADFPSYIRRAQRHLEKGQFTPVFTGTHTGYQIPTDILSLTLPATLVDSISEVVLVYARKDS